MNFIKIDPYACTVTTVEGDGSNESFCQLLGSEFWDVCARQHNHDALLVDDDALSRNPQPPAFSFDGIAVHGIAIVTGCDWDGKTTEPTFTVEQVVERITWLGAVQTKPALVWKAW
ncbi:hypothetical protein BN8_p06754 (plasmid) [Fibrisoma limi BUZ 3]|uniref:DUF3846 domain-containing protein n=1 Tax=Fibrisoma limi BUZ 3 TaxID=1185876 RepID=I2GTW7_9BACT|nr:hypothetical protein [Fibrisoma limi]CCH57568.1 hypothetical protein BN8_p06754 [Fibrisoma limi BUZ 3]